MEPRTFQYMAEALGGELLRGDPKARACGLALDSRLVEVGQAFLAIVGERHDAHAHMAEAVQRGAVLLAVNRARVNDVPAEVATVVVEDTRLALGRLAARYRQDFDATVIGVGGSNGKTSTKELLAATLGAARRVVASEASFNNDIGVPATLLRLTPATQILVAELGTNHPGELAPLVRMAAPQLGVVTSLGREHLEHFGDLAGVVREEGALAEGLPAGGVLIVNGDTPGIDALVARAPGRVVRVGFAAGNLWRIECAQGDGTGNTFQLKAPLAGYTGEYRVPLLGRHAVTNAALAVAVAAELEIPAAIARVGLASARAAKRRLNLLEFGGVRVLDDAYNANPDSVLAALQTLNDLPCAGRRVAVLGDMAELGTHAETAHVEVGLAAARLGLDRLVAVGRHAELMAGAARQASLVLSKGYPSASEAARAVLSGLAPGDIVLVKASRSSRLEEVVEILRQELGSAPAVGRYATA